MKFHSHLHNFDFSQTELLRLRIFIYSLTTILRIGNPMPLNHFLVTDNTTYLKTFYPIHSQRPKEDLVKNVTNNG